MRLYCDHVFIQWPRNRHTLSVILVFIRTFRQKKNIQQKGKHSTCFVATCLFDTANRGVVDLEKSSLVSLQRYGVNLIG